MIAPGGIPLGEILFPNEGTSELRDSFLAGISGQRMGQFGDPLRRILPEKKRIVGIDTFRE